VTTKAQERRLAKLTEAAAKRRAQRATVADRPKRTAEGDHGDFIRRFAAEAVNDPAIMHPDNVRRLNEFLRNQEALARITGSNAGK
jgi:hypothetical protein